MITEISAAISGVKAAADLAKALNDTMSQAALNEVKIGLQEKILDAHGALLAAQAAEQESDRRIADLEQQINQFNAWDAGRDRYELTAVDSGAFAYTLKPGREEGEPPHWLCPTCFNRRIKSLFQFENNLPREGRDWLARWKCHTCSSTLTLYQGLRPGETQ